MDKEEGLSLLKCNPYLDENSYNYISEFPDLEYDKLTDTQKRENYLKNYKQWLEYDNNLYYKLLYHPDLYIEDKDILENIYNTAYSRNIYSAAVVTPIYLFLFFSKYSFKLTDNFGYLKIHFIKVLIPFAYAAGSYYHVKTFVNKAIKSANLEAKYFPNNN